jgi:hypothetical protein
MSNDIVTDGCLTLASITKAMKECEKLLYPSSPQPMRNYYSMMGFDIILAPERKRPKLELSKDCPVSDKFRHEFNLWLLQMFGDEDVNPVRPGEALVFGNKILMRSEDVFKITNLCG